MADGFALFAIRWGGGTPITPVDQEWSFIRELSADEYESVEGARALLRRLVSQSELSEVEGYRTDLIEVVAQQLDHVAARGLSDHAIHRKTARRFSDFLRAFASFDERTSGWLYRQFGPDSDERDAFKASTHVEFDSSAAYRIARGLRDALTHGGEVLTSKVHGRTEPGGGSSLELELSIDGPQVVTDFGSRLKAITRREIAGAAAPIHGLPIVESAFECCTRLHAQMCLSIENQYIAAITLLEALWREADGPDVHQAYVTNDFYNGPANARGGRQISGVQPIVEFDWQELRGLPDRWRAAASIEVTGVSVADLCVSPDIRVYRDPQGAATYAKSTQSEFDLERGDGQDAADGGAEEAE